LKIEKHSLGENYDNDQRRKIPSRRINPRAGKEKGPEDFSSGPSTYEFLVRLAGIEPTTPWFVAKYSIQLSYSRVGNIIKH
jgi:hypothetical protein